MREKRCAKNYKTCRYMDYNHIRTVLEKYWEGESSLAEEAELRVFFQEHKGPLPDDLREAAPLFQYFSEEAARPLPEAENFPMLYSEKEGDLLSYRNAAEPVIPYGNAADQSRPSVNGAANTSVSGKTVRLSPLRHWMKYAAVLLMAIGIGYALKQQQLHRQIAQPAAVALGEDSFEDPEKAYAETKKALQLLARNLSKGTNKMQKLSYFNDATEIVQGNNNN